MGRQGLISGLGAGLSLVVAGAVALTLLSTLVAFDGLPTLRASRDIAEIRLPDTPPPARDAGVRSPARAVRLQPRPRAGGGPAPRAAVPAPAPSGGGGAPDVPAPAPAPPPPPPEEPVTPPAPEPVITPGPVEDVTRQVQEVLDPVVRATEEVTSLLPLPAP